ncbi:acyl-CoA dehydrogenase C-terminal domain-containing protein [Pseudomonadales bacterium]|nr:acyl-CoA dehydrogenase C-terminal domain-containing protein [Pseudomonadales bacterium]
MDVDIPSGGYTGIQAMDLLGRKMLIGGGKDFALFDKLELKKFFKKNGLFSSNPHKKAMCSMLFKLSLMRLNMKLLTLRIGLKAKKNPDNVGGAAVDYIMYSGYFVMGYFWAVMAQTAHEKLATNPDNADFYKAKIQTAEFYFARLLPRAVSHRKTMMSGSDNVMAMKEENFSFDY